MFIRKLEIEGYKNAKNNSKIIFNEGLNILVGENGVGKTTIINALRMILREDDYGNKVKEEDFYKSFENQKDISDNINIKLLFEGLSQEEKIEYLSWSDAKENTILNMSINNKINNRGYYRKEIWGGVSKSSIYESELLENIECIYLPPLRDSETKLIEGRNSRLARLLQKKYKGEIEEKKRSNKEISIVEETREFNRKLIENENSKIKQANNLITEKLKQAVGKVFGQTTNIQFSEIDFYKIIHNLRLMFFPNTNISNQEIEKFRNISENSLGYNNLLYIATILAEIELNDEKNYKVILIEEPEAHLHPQLQIKFIKYIESIVEKEQNLQIIVTTHSTVLASSVSIENIIHITEKDNEIKAVNIKNIGLENKNIRFLNRWLDVTKSNILFAKGIILVEGISEGILVPELAKICLRNYNKENENEFPLTLEEAGVSVINLNGIFFEQFMGLYCNIKGEEDGIKRLPNKCSGITDKDPDKEVYPDFEEDVEGKNKALKLISNIDKSENVRLYSSKLKTFEYDLCMNKNTKIMAEVLKELWPKENDTEEGVKNKLERIINKDDLYNIEDKELVEDSKNIYKWIDSSEIGKGIFAQSLAEKICSEEKFNVPEYIRKAVLWSCGGKVDE